MVRVLQLGDVNIYMYVYPGKVSVHIIGNASSLDEHVKLRGHGTMITQTHMYIRDNAETSVVMPAADQNSPVSEPSDRWPCITLHCVSIAANILVFQTVDNAVKYVEDCMGNT